MPVAIKPRGGALEPSFREAAWALERIGDISRPVRTRMGWHVLKLDEHKRPVTRLPDLGKSAYLDWVTTEYETEKMQEWVAGLRKAADIKKVGEAQLASLKTRRYWKGR